MSKFVQMLSSNPSATLTKRAEILAENTLSEVETLISTLKAEKRALTSKLLNLTDLSPENTYDLRPGGPNFDAKTWVSQLHKLRMDLALKDVEINEANEIFNEWFAEEVKESKSKK